MNQPFDITRLLRLVAANDPTAAAEVDALADRLRELAKKLRVAAENPFAATGGATDRVKMKVVSPDGSIKQTIDTNPGNED